MIRRGAQAVYKRGATTGQVVALEITWVRGTAMVQTLFTCLYCHCPNDVVSEPLKLYLQVPAPRFSVHRSEFRALKSGPWTLSPEL